MSLFLSSGTYLHPTLIVQMWVHYYCTALSHSDEQYATVPYAQVTSSNFGDIDISVLSQGASTGEKWTQLASKLGSGGRELHPEGGRIHSVFVHKKIKHCRFETKMRQNAPNPIFQFPFFPLDPRHWGLCPQTPGEGGRERGGEGKGMGSLRHCRSGG